mgnify:CR=1 FL=1
MSASSSYITLDDRKYVNYEKLNAKKKWVKRWLIQRNRFFNSTLIRRMNLVRRYRNYLRMDDSAFYYLLNKIRPRIEKRNKVMRDAVSAEEKHCNTEVFNKKELSRLKI